uniref:Uncharacterized protein n=1 Tax=Panagrolaimus davidi TaxID=227884 RepID=A0A914PNF2_9BILA
MSTTAAAARLPSQPPPPPPPPVTIEPYFEQVAEESAETSSNSSVVVVGGQDQARVYPSTGWQAAATIPPRTPSQNDFFRDQRFRFSTSPRRSNRGVLNAEGLQMHPSYLAYRRGKIFKQKS